MQNQIDPLNRFQPRIGVPVTPEDRELVAQALANGILRRIREDFGLTQQYIADQTHTTKGAVSRWESGQRAPTGYAVRYLTDLIRFWGADAV